MKLFHVYSKTDDSISKMFTEPEQVRAFLRNHFAETQESYSKLTVDTIQIYEDGDYNRVGHTDGSMWYKYNSEPSEAEKANQEMASLPEIERNVISTSDEAVAFLTYCVRDLHCELHPDDDFADYLPEFSEVRISALNARMEECFVACEKENLDIYDLVLEVHFTLNKQDNE